MSNYTDFILSGVPVGGTIPFFGGTVHTGFLKGNGAAYSRTAYAKLFAELTVSLTGSTTNLSAIVTGISSTANLAVDMFVSGTGIPALATILTVDSATQVTLSLVCTATGAPTILFSHYGIGDGSTTFNIPDSRGEFLRSWDDTRGVDGGRALGSWQVSQNLSHVHNFEGSPTFKALGFGGVATTQLGVNVGAGTSYRGMDVSGGTESRPRNLSVQFLIKY